MATCKACGVELIWAITPKGATAAIETLAALDGTVLLMRPKGFGSPLAVVLSKTALLSARDRHLPLHKDHHATCPEAGRFRS